MNNIKMRADCLLSTKQVFGQPACNLGSYSIAPPDGEQKILRMMIRKSVEDPFLIPPILRWLEPAILHCDMVQNLMGISQPFVYVTVRHGPVDSVTDDLWHVDGFSMRTPHIPEQNYIWADCFGTEVLEESTTLPQDFDPMKHNIHKYFQDYCLQQPENIKILEPKNLWLIDPYVIHRRPSVPSGTQRTFFRISFIPIEVEDDTCTPNPLMALKKYNRADIRKTLMSYSSLNH